MSGELNVGTLTAYLRLDDSGLRTAPVLVERAMQQAGQAGAVAATKAGKQMATGLTAGVAKSAEQLALIGKQAGARLAEGVAQGTGAAVTSLDRLGAAATIAGGKASEAMDRYRAAAASTAPATDATVASLGRLGAEATIQAAKAEDALAAYAAAAKLAGAEAGAGLAAGITEGTSVAESKLAGASAAVKGLVGGLFAGFAIGGALEFFKDASTAAQADVEGARRVKLEFGEAADSVLEFSEKAANSFGMSAGAANAAAAKMGEFLGSFKIGGQQAADMSIKLVGLSADIAKFAGADPAAVEDAIQTALKGRATALKQFGINVSAANVAQEAFTHGIAAQGATLTDQQKALATYYAIIDQSKDKAGTFAASQNLISTSQQQLTANLENFAGKVGETVLPILATLSGLIVNTVVPAFSAIFTFVQPVIGAFNSMPGPIKEVAAGLGVLLLLRGPLSGMMDTIAIKAMLAKDSLVGLAASAEGSKLAALGASLGTGLKTVGSGLLSLVGGPVGLAVIGVTAGIYGLVKAFEAAGAHDKELKAVTDSLTDSLNQQTGAITSNTKATLVQSLSSDGTLKKLNDLGLSVTDYTNAVLGNTDAQRSLVAQSTYAAGATVAQSASYKKLKADLDAAGISQTSLATAMLTGNWSAVQAQWDKYGSSLKQGSSSLTAYNAEQSTFQSLQQQGVTIMAPYAQALGDIGSLQMGLASDSKAVVDAFQRQADATAKATIETNKIAVADAQARVLRDQANGTMDEQTAAAKDLAAAQVTLRDSQHALTLEQLPAAKGFVSVTAAMADATGAVQQGSAEAARSMDGVGVAALALPATLKRVAIDMAAQKLGIKVAFDPNGVETFTTKTEAAFAKFNTDAQEASTQASLFWFAMEDPKRVTTQETIYADAAAVRALGASYRSQAADVQAVADKQAALTTVQNKSTGKQKDGTDYTSAQKTADEAAATRDLADAQDALHNSDSDIYEAQQKLGQLDATRNTQLFQQVVSTKGYNAAVAAVTKSLTAQRAAFIAAQPQADILSGRAAKAADAVGLIPKNAKIYIDADNANALKAIAAAKADAVKVAAQKYQLAITADITDALTKYKAWFGNIDAMPKSVKTKFDADVAAAEKDGKKLYQVYDATTGKWTAQFMTPNAAAAKATAGGLVKQYDLAKGDWTANLIAKDSASSVIDALNAKIQSIQDKTIKLVVDATGTGTATIQADGSFITSGGTKGQAEGGTIPLDEGTPGKDSVLRMLMPGEEVIKTKQATKHRALLKAINNGMAEGGTVGGVNVYATETGNINGALAGVASIFGNAQKSADSITAAAKKAAAAAVVPTSSSAGVEQWRALANSVFAAKGVPLQYVQTMLNQMNQESSGNPSAINLTDINAQEGHPSVGLLQFIPSTFASFADPGFNSNIYDPASQFHAFINYINGNYGGMASFTAREESNGWGPYAVGGTVPLNAGTPGVDSVRGLLMPGEEVIRTGPATKHRALLKAINAEHFADGGTVGSSTLAGAADPTYGDRLGRVVQAIGGITSEVAGVFAQVATDKAAAVSAEKALADAEYNRRAATTKADKAAADAALHLAQIQAANAEATATASERNYRAAAAAQLVLQGSYQRLSAFAARYDSLTTSLATAQDALTQSKSDKASAVAGYASSIAGFGGGITGNSDRTTSGAVLAGLRYNLQQDTTFGSELASLAKRGLSSQLLNQIEGQYGSGGEITAKALFKGSYGDIRSANALQAQINAVAGKAAQVGPSAEFDKTIRAQSKQVADLTWQMKSTNLQLDAVASRIAPAVERALSSWELQLSGKGLLTLIHPHVQAAVTTAKGAA